MNLKTLIAEQKKIAGLARDALAHENIEKAKKYFAQSMELAKKINQSSETLSTEEAYGLMALSEKGSEKNSHVDSAKQLIPLPNGLTAGITHFPGDTRFHGGRPMTAKYGHIRNLPKGPDKKAPDIYLGDTPDSPHLFKVQQRNPETMQPDEIKWMAHYSDLNAARDSYCYHCGVNRLGYILPAKWDELSPPNP